MSPTKWLTWSFKTFHPQYGHIYKIIGVVVAVVYIYEPKVSEIQQASEISSDIS